ncbi:metal-sensing transcriptional repressor [Microcoleus sp. FACHB-672]|uniref:metal-sensing transcriptional repressor n=1 Tax=Microcoleus sp. FACHB-672 TaxID=2692825 RepID=UPI00168326E8|nr:metal-sensitive transcriptional regulator [Microcoleus sp. FACHB-672]MBD2043520.1 metal-sensitive transcriptional regulator [Microcoleus sp. FACHB-672]
MIGTNSFTDKTLSLAGKDELGRLQDKDDLYSDHTHRDGHTAHPHVHTEESLRRLVNRLSRIEGHIRGIKTMVQESKPCPDVLVQVAAVRGALDRVARIILDEHLTECIARAAKEGNIDDEIEELKAALDRFLPREKKKDSGTKN